MPDVIARPSQLIIGSPEAWTFDRRVMSRTLAERGGDGALGPIP